MAVALSTRTKTLTNKQKAALAVPLTGAQQLVRRYWTALGLLALLSVGGQIAVQSALRAPQTDAPAAAAAGQQQTLGQHLVLSALAVQSSQTPAERAAWERDLRETTDLWEHSEKTLPRSSASIGAALTEAEDAQKSMLQSARGLLAALPPDNSTQRTDLSRYLAPLFQDQKHYQESMETVAAAYGQQATAHLNSLRALAGGLLALSLFALAALAALAVKPAQGTVQRTITALDAMEEQIAGQNNALGEADKKIGEMRQILENLSTVDSLTGLKNHRAFYEQLDREMGRALRHGHPLSLLLLDIDRFKSYNDSFGHADGDRALTVISDILKENGRISDIPARFGGEEFAVILTETDMMGAVVLGERLRQAIASADGLQRPLTGSIGIATLTPNIFSVAGLIAHADRALCHAKGDGRNRVSHAHRIPAPLEDEAPSYAHAA